MNINIKLTRSENAQYHGVNVGTVISMDIEEYLRGVVPSEVSASWDADALRAQAIAARTYGIFHGAGSQTINDTTQYQSYHTNKIDYRTDAAITATAGIVLTYNSSIIDAVFSASNGGRCVSAQEHWGNALPYLIAQNDPWTQATGEEKQGHSVGLSQYGAMYAAGTLGKTYQQILAFYYPGTSLTANYNGAGSGSSGTYTTWQAKYGNNTFVNSNSYSGNVYRFQVDMNKWRRDRSLSEIGEDGKWGSESTAATLTFQQAYSDLTDDGKAGPATKAKLFTLHGQ